MANYAFIDSQNLNMATHTLGWNMDWAKFRAHLKQEYNVDVAYLFMGYMPEHQEMYSSLQKAGYIVVFKPVSVNREGEVKGNIDAELVLQAMIDFERYDGALIVTGDGDFASLVSHLSNKNKLTGVLIPNQRQYSPLLKSAAKDKIFFINNLRRDLEYRRYNGQRQPSRSDNGERSNQPSEAHQPAVQAAPTLTKPQSQAEPAVTSSPAVLSATPPREPRPNPANQTRGRRNSSARNLEDSIIKATSGPVDPPAVKPRVPRRRPVTDQPSSQG